MSANSIAVVRRSKRFAVSATTMVGIYVVLLQYIASMFAARSRGHATWRKCRKCGGGEDFWSEKDFHSPWRRRGDVFVSHGFRAGGGLLLSNMCRKLR